MEISFEDFEHRLDALGVHSEPIEYYSLMNDLMYSDVEIDDAAENLLMHVQQRIIDNKRAIA